MTDPALRDLIRILAAVVIGNLLALGLIHLASMGDTADRQQSATGSGARDVEIGMRRWGTMPRETQYR